MDCSGVQGALLTAIQAPNTPSAVSGCPPVTRHERMPTIPGATSSVQQNATTAWVTLRRSNARPNDNVRSRTSCRYNRIEEVYWACKYGQALLTGPVCTPTFRWAVSMSKPPKKKTGPITRAFLKGLSIILPAVITIAIFAWVWDVLRVYVVELTIQAIDSVKLYEARKLSPEELEYLPDNFFVANGAEGAVPASVHSELTLRRMPRVMDLPEQYQGLTAPGQARSLLQYVLDANNWQRTYDPVNGRVVSYHWFDYLLASVLGLTLVVLLGFLARNFFGRKFVGLLEWFVTKVPVIRSIYPHAKQLVE